ncbi:MAG: hypothetical protein IKC37_03365 [Clostridia bacterium]|nr:hypothetical protein [Clostridia bacterium]
MIEAKTEMEKRLEKAKADAQKKKAQAIEADYLARKEERRKRESEWLLSGKFVAGEQYYDVMPDGEVAEEDKRFFWQSRRVFNRIAPTIDARMAKLVRAIPKLRVRAFSGDEAEVQAAKLSTAILQSVKEKLSLHAEIEKGTRWAEVCGSVFYKIVWDAQAGKRVGTDGDGNPVYEGEISVSVTPPFEIFPSSLCAENMAETESLIHAKVVPAAYVFEKFGVAVTPSEIPVSTLGGDNGRMKDGVVYIERYTLPTQAYPDGRLEIVAGGELLYEGDLPYLNAGDGGRTYPFVKQDCLSSAGNFFGGSIVARLIPLQRAYNAVRNRKHEFLNRAAFGVLTVEDGSLDADELADEGLAPGRVLVYRQGGNPPKFLDGGDLPAQFEREEEWLEKEFAVLSGISDFSQRSYTAAVTSATGLQLMLAQDNSRLQNTVAALESATQEIGRHILRLYKQFAGTARLASVSGEGDAVQSYYFNASDLHADDVTFESEAIVSVEEKRETLLRLYEAGILTGEDGKVSTKHKNEILEAFGLEALEGEKDVVTLHIQKAAQENIAFATGEVAVEDFDDHAVHIAEHTRHLLTVCLQGRDGAQTKARATAHLNAHKRKLKDEE